MTANKPFTWQRIKAYPNSGQIFGSNGTVLNIHESYDRFMHKKVVEYSPIIESKPRPAFSFLRNRTVPANSPNVALVGGENMVDGTLGLVQLYTREVGRYLPGLYGIAGLGVRFSNFLSGTYEFGYGDDEGNRIGVRVVDGQMFTVLDSGGVSKVLRPRSEWLDQLDGSGDPETNPSGIDIGDDVSKLVFRTQIGWYGYLSIEYKFVIASRENGDQLVTFDTVGLEDTDSVSLEQPDLPIYAEANGGIIYVGGRQYGVYGRYVPEYRVTTTQAVSKTLTSAGFVPIMSLKIKDGSTWNSVPVQFNKFTAQIDNSCEYEIIVHDPADGLLTGFDFGATGITRIPATETALEIDVAATAIDLTAVPSRTYKMYGDIFSGGAGRNPNTSEEDVPDVNLPKGLILTLIGKADATDVSSKNVMKFKEEW